MTIPTQPIVSQLDFIMTLSNLSETADYCVFLDASEEGFKACSLTFFHKDSHATLAVVYTAQGGIARIFNSQMKTVAQVLENITLEDYHGIQNAMLKIQEDLGTPPGVDKEFVNEILEGLK
jgi:hypothetical protein